MASVTLEIPPAKLAEIDKKFSIFIEQKKIDQAINSAADRAAKAGMTETKRRIPKQYTIPKAHIQDAKVISASRNAGTGITGASFRIKDSPHSLINYDGVSPKQANTGGPLKVHIRKSNAAKVIRGRKGPWFVGAASRAKSQINSGSQSIAVFNREPGEYMKNPYTRHEVHGIKDSKGEPGKGMGQPGTFKSVWGESRRKNWKHKREKIKKRHTLGASAMFSNLKIGPYATDRAREILNKRLDHEIKRLLEKK
ncbi:MAG: hypothetical protein LBS19_09350 [Clostridiales bacterium]|jgi:hypothetical protein|nr:hypothetical protein [Clostridiales bacterium]